MRADHGRLPTAFQLSGLYFQQIEVWFVPRVDMSLVCTSVRQGYSLYLRLSVVWFVVPTDRSLVHTSGRYESGLHLRQTGIWFVIVPPPDRSLFCASIRQGSGL